MANKPAAHAADEPAVREVVSLDALSAQRRDALPEPTTFGLKGIEFTLPPMKLLPIETQAKVGNMDDNLGVLNAFLGEEQVKAMFAADYTFDDLELIMEEWQKRSGLEPGEAPAS
ncbi:hypothetical protein OG216_09615 [Streptomycetaceae bacterium NBC_01309]